MQHCTENFISNVSVFYEKTGRHQSKVFKIKARLHNTVLLYRKNYSAHIKDHHNEITFKKIIDTLQFPDYVYKHSKSSSDYYYEKVIYGTNYRVVVSKYDKGRMCVITAYSINEIEFDPKHICCVYDHNDKYIHVSPDKDISEDEVNEYLKMFCVKHSEGSAVYAEI